MIKSLHKRELGGRKGSIPVKKLRIKFILVLSIVVLTHAYPAITLAKEPETPLGEAANYFRSNFGVAFKMITLDISDTNTLKTVALLEGDLIPWPYLSFQSPTRYFGQSRFGWLMEYGLSGFKIDEQSEPFSTIEATDRGTSAKGWFLYAMPTLTWDASESFRMGIGLGGGFMSIKGDALIYDPFPTVTRIEYDVAELTWGGYFLTEYVMGNFMIGLHAGVLIAEKDPYDYTVGDASLILAYHKLI
jgi:hypothetical protein